MHKYLGSTKNRFVGSRGLDGLPCDITGRIIGSPLTDEELALIEPNRRPNTAGWLGVQKSSTSASFKACFTAFTDDGDDVQVDLGHRRNPQEAALIYVMSTDFRKPKPRVYSEREFAVKSQTRSLYYFDLDDDDLEVIAYLKTDRNITGYENVTRQMSNGRYGASMIVDKAPVYLGSYITPEEAAFAVHVYFRTGNKDLQNKVPRYNEGQNMFILTDQELLEIAYLKNDKNATGYKGVGYTGTRYTANWNAYKQRLSFGRYLSPEEAAWAIHLYLDLGLLYRDISVLAKTNTLRPPSVDESAMIQMYSPVPLDHDVHIVRTREELTEIYESVAYA